MDALHKVAHLYADAECGSREEEIAYFFYLALQMDIKPKHLVKFAKKHMPFKTNEELHMVNQLILAMGGTLGC